MANPQGGVGQESGSWRRLARALLFAWSVIALGAALLLLRYDDLPGLIPVYRNTTGHASVFAPKSAAIVFRIVVLGAAQLGAMTVMWLHARTVRSTGWGKFWVYGALAAATKTLVESVQYASLATPLARTSAPVWSGAALLPVLVFLALAAYLWRTRQLSTRAASGLTPRRVVMLCMWLGLWLAFATLPRWLD
jgi:hypothetical protein